ncbi:MAG: RDD family protein [Mucilaginibacter polytrichastri]|nr:RDD family protein [Mucilaginibacter polytrichastri]
METIRIRTTQNVDVEYEVAGLGDRILARLIDGAIALAIMFAVIFGLGVTDSGFDTPKIVVFVVVLAIAYVFYDLIFELSMNGQSIGKKLMKIRVISLDGSRPSLGKYLMRWVMRIVDFSLSGSLAAIISVAVSEKRQRIGDMVANTTLIKTNPKTAVTDFNDISLNNEYVAVFAEVSQLTDRDIDLIFEVLDAYHRNRNFELIKNLADKIKSKLNLHPQMDDYTFLQTILKDHQAQTSAL